ncbi:hypothetical protein HAX54_037524 [Datura stramonium]|uniref:Putative plant transposon protein domain-containing protein n=1 Tax=Datura stramonium TaxID=4076 RepID=A0ABS8VK12_DATST|nr:hypothetical protein [Datura stramonium]
MDLKMYFMLLKKCLYHDIGNKLWEEHSASLWARGENGTHSTLSFSYLTKEARAWVNLVCIVLLPGTHTTEISRERVVLVYMLMNGLPTNFGAVLGENMRRSKDNFYWKYCYGSLLT